MRLAILMTALLSVTAQGAEDFRVMKLEQDMRNLEREVRTLQRQVDAISQQAGRRTDPIYESSSSRTPPGETEQAWLSASAWNRVRAGMEELQVIEVLGTPTALRTDDRGRKSLLYTLEIGSTGFLSGSVEFENRKVVEVLRPTLK